MKEPRLFNAQLAMEDAKVIQQKLLGFPSGSCLKVAIAGSLRREQSMVHDIDLVVIPSLMRPYLPKEEVQAILGTHWVGKSGGPKMVHGEWRDIPVDIYFADESSWWTLFLVKTGSKPHNIRLADMAKKKGWRLHADGGGLTDGDGNRIAGQSEQSFFIALGIPYLEPKDREVGNW